MVAALAKLCDPMGPLIGFPFRIKSNILCGHGDGIVHCIMSALAVCLGVPTKLAIVGAEIVGKLDIELVAVHCFCKRNAFACFKNGLGGIFCCGIYGKSSAVSVEGYRIGGNKLPLCNIGYAFGNGFRNCGKPTGKFITHTLGGTGKCRSCRTCFEVIIGFGCKNISVAAVGISYGKTGGNFACGAHINGNII